MELRNFTGKKKKKLNIFSKVQPDSFWLVLQEFCEAVEMQTTHYIMHYIHYWYTVISMFLAFVCPLQ